MSEKKIIMREKKAATQGKQLAEIDVEQRPEFIHSDVTDNVDNNCVRSFFILRMHKQL